VPLRSHGSLSMNRALMAAGLVDRLQVTLFPVITGQTGLDPIFQGAVIRRGSRLSVRTAMLSCPGVGIARAWALASRAAFHRTALAFAIAGDAVSSAEAYNTTAPDDL
jgi:RibD C-terminal domain